MPRYAENLCKNGAARKSWGLTYIGPAAMAGHMQALLSGVEWGLKGVSRRVATEHAGRDALFDLEQALHAPLGHAAPVSSGWMPGAPAKILP